MSEQSHNVLYHTKFYHHWHTLWHNHQRSAGIPVPAGIPGLTCTHGYGSGRCFMGTGIPAFTREKSSQITQLLISFAVTVWWKFDKVYLFNEFKGVLVSRVINIAPGIQRTRQFEIEQRGTRTRQSTTWHERNVGITGEQSTQRSTKKRSAEQCCFLTAMMTLTKELTKSRILPQLLMKSMLIWCLFHYKFLPWGRERRTSGFLKVASHSLPETGGHH